MPRRHANMDFESSADGSDQMIRHRTRQLLREPGAREMLAAYAAAPRAVQQSMLKLIVEIVRGLAEDEHSAVLPFKPAP